MIKILFVCHGNICRSPMAEFVMKHLVKKQGVSDKFEIASAATSTEEIGNPVYPPVKKLLLENGIDSSKKRARQITKEDYLYYDYIIAMDSNNLRNLERLLGEDRLSKISLLMSYTGNTKDVQDPWYTRDFNTTWDDVLKGCNALIKTLIN